MRTHTYICISPHGTRTIVAASCTALVELSIRVIFNVILYAIMHLTCSETFHVSRSLLENIASPWHCIFPPARPQLTFPSLPYTTWFVYTPVHPTLPPPNPGPLGASPDSKMQCGAPSPSSSEVLSLLITSSVKILGVFLNNVISFANL